MFKKVLVAVIVLGVFFAIGSATYAQTSSSPNYQIEESFIGPGGELESSSPNFRTAPGGQSIGNSGGVGDSESSPNYRTQSGATTTSDPSLACITNTSSLDFGALSSSVVSTATATFSVLNYTSYGYIVQVIGAPPASGAHTLTNLTANAASAPGTEQFGINLADNTTPNIGLNPVQNPDNTFSFGEAAPNYDSPDSFRYNNGETVARSVKTSGETNYTMSYIINVATTTPGGSYSGNQTLVCTGTY
ncbi:MAG TPA: hypothetical protein PKB09_01065 [Candidatus Saccharibacteria bacterium]|nr:hypothetical protein [Candidatus Saccharibacteria bacterium]